MSQAGSGRQMNKSTQGVRKRENANVRDNRELQIVNVQRKPYL